MGKENITRRLKIYINGQEVDSTITNITKSLRKFQAQSNRAVEGTPEWKKYNAEVARLDTELKQARSSQNKFRESTGLTTKTLGKGTSSLVGYLKSAAGFLGIGVGIAAVTSQIRKLVTGNVDLEEAEANVMKTTGYTTVQVNGLTKALKQLDTKTPIDQLLGLAEAGGRLNLKGQELIDFVENTDKAFVALGDSLEGEAADIGVTLGKIANNFDLEKKYGTGSAINKIGSALNELGANSKASEGPIVDFTQRLAGVSSQAKISLPDIAALGALFDENGQSIEVAATTFNKLLPAIGKDVEKFAKIAGVNVTEFKDLVEKDAFAALKLVAVGAKSNEEGLVGLSETLENYGVDSARAASIVGILSSKTDRLTELQKISNDAFEEGTSLTTEFNIKNETLGATLSKIGNTLAAKFTGSKTVSFLKGIAEGFFNIIKPSESLVESIKNEQTELNILFTKLTDVNIKEGDRKKIIDELNKNYGDYIGNIDLETASNSDLSTILETINNQYVNKIILQRELDKLEDAGNKVADARIYKTEKTTSALTKLTEAENALGIKVDLTKTLWERRNIALDAANEKTGWFRVQANKTAESLQLLNESNLTGKGGFLEENLNNATSKFDDLTKKVGELKKEFGLTDTLSNGGDGGGGGSDNPKEGDTKTEGGATYKYTGGKWVKQGGGGNGGGNGKPAAEELTPEDQQILDSKKKLAEFLNNFEKDQEAIKAAEQLAKDTVSEEAELLSLENKYLTMAERAGFETVLAAGLEEAKEAELASVREKWANKREKDIDANNKILADIDKKAKENALAAEINLEEAKKASLNSGLNSLMSVFGQKTAIHKLLFGIQKALAVKEIIINAGKANALITANTAIANTAAVAASFMTGGQPWVTINTATAAKNIAATNISAGAAIASILASAIGGFKEGGFTGPGNVNDIAGVTHKNEYVIPQRVMQMPEAPYIVEYLEAKRTGKNLPASNESSSVGDSSSNAELNSLLQLNTSVLLEVSNAVKNIKLNYTLDDERERQLLQKKLDDTIKSSKN